MFPLQKKTPPRFSAGFVGLSSPLLCHKDEHYLISLVYRPIGRCRYIRGSLPDRR